jgi:hypothetical protein
VLIICFFRRYCQIQFRNEEQSVECNQKGVGRNNLVFTDWKGRIRKVECGFLGGQNDRGMYTGSNFFRFFSIYLRPNETVGGDAIFRGCKGAGSRGGPGITDCFAPFSEPELVGNPHRRAFNRLSHRYRVVVENTLAAIKQWLIVKHPYRGSKEDQV